MRIDRDGSREYMETAEVSIRDIRSRKSRGYRG